MGHSMHACRVMGGHTWHSSNALVFRGVELLCVYFCVLHTRAGGVEIDACAHVHHARAQPFTHTAVHVAHWQLIHAQYQLGCSYF